MRRVGGKVHGFEGDSGAGEIARTGGLVVWGGFSVVMSTCVRAVSVVVRRLRRFYPGSALRESICEERTWMVDGTERVYTVCSRERLLSS